MQKITKPILIMLCCTGISTYAQEKTTVDYDQQFIEFLEGSLENEYNDEETKNLFLKESRTYWKDRTLDYNIHPEKYDKTISLFHKNQERFKSKSNQINTKRENRIESAVKNFQDFDDRNTLPKNSILFVGSSSVSGWKTSASFPEFPIINRGVGGMNMHEIIHYYDILIKKHSPSILAVYCDIDIEQGKLPNEATAVFKEFVKMVKTDLPQTSILLLSMKPAMVDDFIGENIRKNKIIANNQLLNYSTKEKNVHYVDLASPMVNPDGKLNTSIFVEDGMHLNELGYAIWNPIIRDKLIALTREKNAKKK